MTKLELEGALNATVERYEASRHGASPFAQVDLPFDYDVWGAIADHIGRIGPRIMRLRQEGRIGATCIDLAISFAEDQFTLGVVVPSSAAVVIGQCGIDVELTIYRGGD